MRFLGPNFPSLFPAMFRVDLSRLSRFGRGLDWILFFPGQSFPGYILEGIRGSLLGGISGTQKVHFRKGSPRPLLLGPLEGSCFFWYFLWRLSSGGWLGVGWKVGSFPGPLCSVFPVSLGTENFGSSGVLIGLFLRKKIFDFLREIHTVILGSFLRNFFLDFFQFFLKFFLSDFFHFFLHFFWSKFLKFFLHFFWEILFLWNLFFHWFLLWINTSEVFPKILLNIFWCFLTALECSHFWSILAKIRNFYFP